MSQCAPPVPAWQGTYSLMPVLARLAAGRAERRSTQRREFGYRLCLTPIAELPEPGDPNPLYVVGRDLSPRGVGFEHIEPITYRKVRLTAADPRLDQLGLGDLSIEVSLRWCRFIGAGSYESGGSIQRASVTLA